MFFKLDFFSFLACRTSLWDRDGNMVVGLCDIGVDEAAGDSEASMSAIFDIISLGSLLCKSK